LFLATQFSIILVTFTKLVEKKIILVYFHYLVKVNKKKKTKKIYPPSILKERKKEKLYIYIYEIFRILGKTKKVQITQKNSPNNIYKT
jgi:hypothetical protein